MRRPERLGPQWRTSSRSAQDDCVEVANVDGRVLVRDSKDRDGPVLSFTHQQWRDFLGVLTCAGGVDS
jgi:hypothetical protein